MLHSRNCITSVTNPTLKRATRHAESFDDFINSEEFYFSINNSLRKLEIYWRHDNISAF